MLLKIVISEMHWIMGFFACSVCLIVCSNVKTLLEERNTFGWLISRRCGLSFKTLNLSVDRWLSVKRTHCALTKCHSACATVSRLQSVSRLIWEVGAKKCKDPIYLCIRGAVFLTMRHEVSSLVSERVTSRSLESLLVGSKLHNFRSERAWPRIELWLSRGIAHFSPKIKGQETSVRRLHALCTSIGKCWNTDVVWQIGVWVRKNCSLKKTYLCLSVCFSWSPLSRSVRLECFNILLLKLEVRQG